MALIQKIRGTQDILPQSSRHWQHAEQTIRDVMRLYGYSEIRTPIFEATELFARGVGQLTDIVSKEMYTFEDLGGKSLTLKPEGTASVIRAYLENGLGGHRPLNKVYYIGPMFRQEKPQAGRYRQFHQFGAELIGSAEPVADVETILLAIDVYRTLGLRNFALKLNSVGDSNCREQYKQALQAYLAPRLEMLCGTCRSRYERNPMRVLDCKKPACRAETENAPKMIEYLDPDSAAHFQSVCDLLGQNEIAYDIDHRLVRGLDYYTRTAYEVISEDLGAQDALCGGGRYDLLASELGGKPTPAVGFAAGIERALIVLEKAGLLPDSEVQPDLFIAWLGEAGRNWAVAAATAFRREGLHVEIDLLGRSLKAQLREANRSKARFALIAGENELESGELMLKDLRESLQDAIPAESAVRTVLQRVQSAAAE